MTALPRPVERGRLVLVALVVLIGVGQAVCVVAAAMLVRAAYHAIGTTGSAAPSTPQVLGLALGLCAAVCTGAALRGLERVVSERLGQHYVRQVRALLFAHLTAVPPRELAARRRGGMLLRFVGDVSALRNWVSLGLARLVVAGVTVTLVLCWTFVQSTSIGIAVTGVLVAGAVATRAAGDRLMHASRRARRRRAGLTGEIAERLHHIGTVQAAGQQRREQRRIERHSTRVSSAMIDQARAAGVARAIAEGTAGLAGAAVVVVGSVQARSGQVSPGTVLAVLTVVGLLSGQLRDLGRVAEYAANAVVARRAAQRFLELPTVSDLRGAADLPPGPGRIDFDNVSVPGALDAVTLTAPAGGTVAIVGANGAGKSTLLSLVARLCDPAVGRVLLDGRDIRAHRLRSVRRRIGVAGPDLPLLSGTVERNVLYRAPRTSHAELARVAWLCELPWSVAKLPGGWREQVGDAGGRLSSGQRARLGLARAVLGRPDVLLLDEADAHVDPGYLDTLARVLDAHEGTALVVTHRRELVERADLVWCLQDGRVVETGRPADVLGGDGPTARLFAADGVGSDQWRSKSTAEYARSLPSWCTESSERIVPDFERMTIDWVATESA